MKSTYTRIAEGTLGVLALVLLYFSIRDISLAEVWTILHRVDLLQVLGYLGLNGLIALILANRWWIVLRGLGVHLSYLQVAEFRLIGATVSLLTPGPQFGGEPLQVHLLTRRQVALPRAIASVTLERTLELAGNFAFLLAGIFFVIGRGSFRGSLSWTAPVLALGLLCLPMGLLLVFGRGGQPVSACIGWIARVLPKGGLHRWVQQTLALAVRAAEQEIYMLIRHRPGVVVTALVASLANWGILVGEYWLATQILHMELALGEIITLLVAARIAILMPTPGGLGALEAGQVFTLVLLGHEPAAGIGLSLLMRIRDLSLIAAGLGLAHRHGWFRFGAKRGSPTPSTEETVIS